MISLKKNYDAIVVGAGPAGSSTAALLAKKGHDVLVVEKEKFPRYHVGESLMPFCYFPLERLGLVDTLMESANPRKYCVQFVRQDGFLSQPFYFFQHFDHPSSTTRLRRGRPSPSRPPAPSSPHLSPPRSPRVAHFAALAAAVVTEGQAEGEAAGAVAVCKRQGRMSLLEWLDFCQECQLHDNVVTLKQLEEVFLDAHAATRPDCDSLDRKELRTKMYAKRPLIC